MEIRKATEEEQFKIDEANVILRDIGLTITELKDERGTVLPSKGF